MKMKEAEQRLQELQETILAEQRDPFLAQDASLEVTDLLVRNPQLNPGFYKWLSVQSSITHEAIVQACFSNLEDLIEGYYEQSWPQVLSGTNKVMNRVDAIKYYKGLHEVQNEIIRISDANQLLKHGGEWAKVLIDLYETFDESVEALSNRLKFIYLNQLYTMPNPMYSKVGIRDVNYVTGEYLEGVKETNPYLFDWKQLARQWVMHSGPTMEVYIGSSTSEISILRFTLAGTKGTSYQVGDNLKVTEYYIN